MKKKDSEEINKHVTTSQKDIIRKLHDLPEIHVKILENYRIINRKKKSGTKTGRWVVRKQNEESL